MKAKKDKQLALKLVEQKLTDPTITYEHISSISGYTKRQCIRFTNLLKEKDMNSILKHGNSDKPPSTTASDQEISCLRQLKESYPNITIAQFRDIYLEDIIFNKKMKTYVKKNSLVPRSSSWFRNLFIREGWKSPAQRKLRRGGRSQHTLRDPAGLATLL